ncbi:MAG: transporter substrate-binding domain-containing protein [Chloroflexota bacterium]|nr:transporter substrate-binding domain-containing protein [Chloroflexota bacterium]
MECEWIVHEWEGLFSNLMDGQLDAIIAGMSITDERAELIGFTQAYYPPQGSRYLAYSDAGEEALGDWHHR